MTDPRLTPPIVCLDASPARRDPTGVGVYVRELAQALEAPLAEGLGYIGVRRDGPLSDQARRSGRWAEFRGRQTHLWLQRYADRDARGLGASLVHYTNGAAPIRSSVPYVLTIQDVSVARMPRAHPPQRVVTLPVLLIAARRAAAIICPSHATARELRRLFHLPAARIHVVPHAASALRGGDPALDADAVARLGLEPGRFILAPGTLEPRKNHRRLVRAFEMLAARDRGMRLVIVGAPGWGYGPILKAIEQSPMRDRILLTGFVDDELLASLLRTCALVAYVSLYEGFGLPVTEAMSAGAPVVTLSVSSLPEVAGDAAVLVDPDDPVAIHRGLVEALDRAAELRAAGPDRAARWTWADAARETLAVYQQVLRAREGGEP